MRTPEERKRLRDIYRDGLLHDTIPFWFPRSVDREHGGFLTCFDRDGSILQTDKSVWFQGRFAWMLATLYNTVERKGEWLDLARHGVEFINEHCFDTRRPDVLLRHAEGRPLRKRRYIFSEIFAIIALAAYGQAAGDDRSTRAGAGPVQAASSGTSTRRALLPPKTDPEVRPMKGLAMPMSCSSRPRSCARPSTTRSSTEVIDRAIAEVERDFLKPEFQCVLETVGPNGEFLRHLRRAHGLPGPCHRGRLVHPRRGAPARRQPPPDRPRHEDHRLVAGDRLGPRIRRAPLFPRRPGPASAPNTGTT